MNEINGHSGTLIREIIRIKFSLRNLMCRFFPDLRKTSKTIKLRQQYRHLQISESICNVRFSSNAASKLMDYSRWKIVANFCQRSWLIIICDVFTVLAVYWVVRSRLSLTAAVWPQFATQVFRGGIGRLACIGSYVNKQVTTSTFRAQATTCSKHHTRTVVDAGCECAS